MQVTPYPSHLQTIFQSLKVVAFCTIGVLTSSHLAYGQGTSPAIDIDEVTLWTGLANSASLF